MVLLLSLAERVNLVKWLFTHGKLPLGKKLVAG